MHYSDYTTEQISSALQTNNLLIPVGAIEQHGPHLPLSVDIDIATAIANELSVRGKGITAPGIVYGARSQPHSGGGPSFPGTIFVRGSVLINYFIDIIKAFVDAGAKKLVVLNGHYENEPFLFEAFEVCRENGFLSNTSLISVSWWSVIKQEIIDDLFGIQFPGWHAEHASTVETSLMMYIKPQLVNDIRLENATPPLAGVYLHPIDSSAISNRGVLANTQGASKELGEKLYKIICHEIETLLENPHGMSPSK